MGDRHGHRFTVANAPEHGLSLDAAVDGDDAPREVIVGDGVLAGQPHEGGDRKGAVFSDVDDV